MDGTTIVLERSGAPPRQTWTAVELQDRYYTDIFNFFARRVRPVEEAEDLTAATFLAAFQNLGKIRNADARIFLYGVARRKLADALRKRRAVGTLDIAEHIAAPVAPTAMFGDALRNALRSIPEDQAEALMLQNLEDLGVREIAQVMDRSEKSVKALLQRAKENLRNDPSLRTLAEEIHV